MAKAAELRKQVRQALAEQNKAREDAVMTVVDRHADLVGLREQVAAAEESLRDAVQEAQTKLTRAELTALSGISDLPRATSRKGSTSNGSAKDPEDSTSDGGQ